MKEEGIKEIGVWTVACWIFAGLAGLISIFSVVVTIKAGQVFTGLLFLIPGIFVFVPRKYLKISRPLKTIIFIFVYLSLLVISGNNMPKPEQQYEYYSLGQKFNLTLAKNSFSVVITNTTEITTLILNGKERPSSGIYLVVNGDITNNQKNPLDISFSSELKDNQNNSYSLFVRNMVSGQLQPNLKRDFSHIFEIPKEYAGLKIFFKDNTPIIKVVNLEK